jgi:HEAT repeat protein
MASQFELWCRRMKCADPGERAEAARLIPSGHDGEVVDLLIAALDDAIAVVRARAAGSLRWFKNEERVEAALLRLLDTDGNSFVRAYAMSSLAEIAGLRGYGEVVERWYRESDPRVKLQAALGAMQGLQAIVVDEILRHAATNDEDLKGAALNALHASLDSVDEARRRIFSVIVAKQRAS